MTKVYAFDGITPVVHPSAYVHPSAVLIGDVIVAPRAYIGPCACLRGDFGRIVIGEGANIQDTCVLHGFPDRDLRVDADGHIGHGAVLHGCVIERDALVGINAVVNDNAVVGESAIVAAMAFVKADFVVPARSLAAGIPARVMRALSEDEIAWKREATRQYQDLAARSLRSMKAVAPLESAEAGRARHAAHKDAVPLSEMKRRRKAGTS
jgi:phenylacetic acid degradation protein